jgi:hypothetical protein
MAKANASKQIPASQDAVWSQLSDMSTYEKWLTIHDKWYGEPPTQLAVGTRATEQATIMGMANKIDWVVEEIEAPNRLKIVGAGLAGAKITFVLAVESEGPDASVASIDAEFISQIMVGAIGAAVERAANKEVAASLDNLAGLLA